MNNIQLYKQISLDIISAIKNEKIDIISELLDKRQEILDIEEDNKEFRISLSNYGILDIDKEIQKLLSESILKVKSDIKRHKQSVQANNSYTNSFRENLNIFYKKV